MGKIVIMSCGACGGSGEGMFSGSRCPHCKGIGEIEVVVEENDEEEEE